MGGFVNDPAFADIAPIWASSALAAKSQSENEHPNQNIMAKSQIEIMLADPQAVAAKLAHINKTELALNPRFNHNYFKDKCELAAERASLIAREISATA